MVLQLLKHSPMPLPSANSCDMPLLPTPSGWHLGSGVRIARTLPCCLPGSTPTHLAALAIASHSGACTLKDSRNPPWPPFSILSSLGPVPAWPECGHGVHREGCPGGGPRPVLGREKRHCEAGTGGRGGLLPRGSRHPAQGLPF